MHTHSEAETLALGERIGQQLRAGDIVLLRGRPGAGKTALARGIARGLGYSGYVNSPTFTLVNEYEGRLPVYHMDLYRLEGGELDELGLDEYLYSGGVCLIEWPQLLDGLEGAATVDIDYIDETTRSFTLHGVSVCED